MSGIECKDTVSSVKRNENLHGGPEFGMDGTVLGQSEDAGIGDRSYNRCSVPTSPTHTNTLAWAHMCFISKYKSLLLHGSSMPQLFVSKQGKRPKTLCHSEKNRSFRMSNPKIETHCMTSEKK